MNDILPWRQPPRDHFPGVPAWGAPISAACAEGFEVSPLGPVTPEWAWGGADGSGVRACVLDSGVDGDHPMVGGLDNSVDVVADGDGDCIIVAAAPVDMAGHGTACASVIRSLAPRVSLTSARVLGSGAFGSGPALIAGLNWAVDEGFDVINLSLSTTKAKYQGELAEAVDRAYFRRCLVVASAHNMPVRSYPWQFASVISVASHDGPDPMTYYYNPSPPVEFYARGIRVPVAWPGGGHVVSSGNSFATPHIAGMCALILSKHALLTPFQVKTVLYLAASNVAGRDGGEHVSQ